jgi:hypothetical protein
MQTNITATVFGGQRSAYGGHINNSGCGVALPFHFIGDRPKVRVSCPEKGTSVDCDIVDVGPWNGRTVQTSDPYWLTNTRPQAESGTDLIGRKTNGAGIDLTPGAAQALGIDGKGLVSWEFVPAAPAAPSGAEA